MVLRTAKRGKFVGQPFYGCSGYPDCKKIINIDQMSEIPNEVSDDQKIPDFVKRIKEKIKKKKIEKPQVIDCQPLNRAYQVRIFENTWTLPEIVTQLNRKRNSIDEDELSAFAQWRLDYPKPQGQIDLDLLSPFAVLEKILLRGSIIPCSPTVNHEIMKHFSNFDNNIGVFLDLIQSVENHPRNYVEFSRFDSDSEKDFYSEFISQFNNSRNIVPWIFPQASFSNLTQNAINPGSNQKVDFLFSHPVIENFIVEIDGPQHEDSNEADARRDKLLNQFGFKVFRIKTADQYMKELEINVSLQSHFEEFKKYKILEVRNNPYLEILLLMKAAFQIQVSLLEAIKSGHIDLKQKSNYKIEVIPPYWFSENKMFSQVVDISINDFTNTLGRILDLFNVNRKDLNLFSIHPQSEEDVSLRISFNSSFKPKKPNIPEIFVSDTYLPLKISQEIPASDPTKIQNPSKVIVRYFLNYIFQKEEFLEGQWEAIKRTIQGKDSIVLLPTGGGKTIAFQLASFLLPGITLVVDPLIALINDQVANLKDYGIDRAVGISSQLDLNDRLIALESFSSGQYLFVYVAPERLQMKDFRSAIQSVTVFAPINIIVIDEAHCVSEWGHDFRVSYLNIARNSRNYCKKSGIVPPILGLTGTASRSVLRDVRRELEILEFDSVITPRNFNRRELTFNIFECRSNEKYERLLGVLSSLPRKFNQSPNNFFLPSAELSNTGLIFFPHVNGELGIKSGYDRVRESIGDYIGLYSGKNPREFPEEYWQDIKSMFADEFKNNDITILTCTNAFGMGIDKPNIRYTIHMNLPRSIEAFYQEAGRAGRDRKRAECTLILSNDFPTRTKSLLDPSKPLEEISETTESISYGDSDDITRALFFHVNTFKGAKEEFREVQNLIELIGDLKEEKTLRIHFDNTDRTKKEKAVHRLVIIGVIRDYTIDYSSSEIEVFISGNNSEENLQSYLNYLRNYDRKFADQAERIASQYLHLSQKDFILLLARKLIDDFIYNIIELSRRRSLNEMLQACINNPTDAGIRSRILSYLELGHFSDILDNAREKTEQLSETILEIMNEIDSPMEANELRGQSARMLEAYPNNPSFLLIRSLAEVFCTDRNDETVFENFNAFLSFSTSETGWGMPIYEVLTITSSFINQVGTQFSSLAQYLVVSTMEFCNNDKETARLLVKCVDEGLCVYPSYLLLGNLNEVILNII